LFDLAGGNFCLTFVLNIPILASFFGRSDRDHPSNFYNKERLIEGDKNGG
jgi:hypothetical protein